MALGPLVTVQFDVAGSRAIRRVAESGYDVCELLLLGFPLTAVTADHLEVSLSLLIIVVMGVPERRRSLRARGSGMNRIGRRRHMPRLRF